jgi:hypothetical protein
MGHLVYFQKELIIIKLKYLLDPPMIIYPFVVNVIYQINIYLFIYLFIFFSMLIYKIIMGGGLMQLVAYGAQDIYLTGNPQITFFKVVYRRHTNFSMECIKQSFKGAVGAGARVVATLARNGDLVHDCFLRVKSNDDMDVSGGVGIANPGHSIINNIEVEIGGQLIDKHFGHWMEAHAQLTEEGSAQNFSFSSATTPQWETNALNTEEYVLSQFQRMAGAGGTQTAAPDSSLENAGKANFYIPLRFWFCRHVGLSLPLIALQYHEVNINMTFTSVAYDKILPTGTIELWCNYIYLDTDERRRFAQVSHEYLIEQVQTQSYSLEKLGSPTIKLNFNHPVKELIWGGVGIGAANSDVTRGVLSGEDWGTHALGSNFVSLSVAGENAEYFHLKLNGHDRFAKQNIPYFTRYQPWKYHTSSGRGSSLDTLFVYSFALKPEEHQPSGTCNFSRIDNAQLLGENIGISGSTVNMKIYAVNYNVLRIMSGMGGLAYSN